MISEEKKELFNSILNKEQEISNYLMNNYFNEKGHVCNIINQEITKYINDNYANKYGVFEIFMGVKFVIKNLLINMCIHDMFDEEFIEYLNDSRVGERNGLH